MWSSSEAEQGRRKRLAYHVGTVPTAGQPALTLKVISIGLQQLGKFRQVKFDISRPDSSQERGRPILRKRGYLVGVFVCSKSFAQASHLGGPCQNKTWQSHKVGNKNPAWGFWGNVTQRTCHQCVHNCNLGEFYVSLVNFPRAAQRYAYQVLISASGSAGKALAVLLVRDVGWGRIPPVSWWRRLL